MLQDTERCKMQK